VFAGQEGRARGIRALAEADPTSKERKVVVVYIFRVEQVEECDCTWILREREESWRKAGENTLLYNGMGSYIHLSETLSYHLTSEEATTEGRSVG
jgi:hypothetical protein